MKKFALRWQPGIKTEVARIKEQQAQAGITSGKVASDLAEEISGDIATITERMAQVIKERVVKVKPSPPVQPDEIPSNKDKITSSER